MYCRFCGKSIPADSTYCPKCGKPLSDINDTVSQPENKPKGMPAKSRIAIICLSAATVILICLVFTLQWQKLQIQEASAALNGKVSEQEQQIQQRDKLIQLNESRILSLSKAQTNYDFIASHLKEINMGAASGYFKTDKSVIVVKKTDNTQKLKLTTSFTNGATINVKYDYPIGEWGVAQLEFDSESWYNNTTMTVRPSKPGVALATFTSSSNDLSFSVLIIVTD